MTDDPFIHKTCWHSHQYFFFLFFLCLLGYCKFRFRKSSHLIRPDSTQMFDYAEKFSCWLVTMHNIVSMLLKWTCDAYFKLCIVVLTALSCCSSNRVTLYDTNFKVIPLYIKLGLVEPYLCLLQKHPFLKKKKKKPTSFWLAALCKQKVLNSSWVGLLSMVITVITSCVSFRVKSRKALLIVFIDYLHICWYHYVWYHLCAHL